MKAPDHARSLIEINPTWEKSELRFVCECGYHGHVGELLVIRDDKILWCPKCKMNTTEWGEKKQEAKTDNQMSFINS